MFRAPLRWSEEVVTLTLLLAFVGAIPVGVARDAHIRVESLYEKLIPQAIAEMYAACGVTMVVTRVAPDGAEDEWVATPLSAIQASQHAMASL